MKIRTDFVFYFLMAAVLTACGDKKTATTGEAVGVDTEVVAESNAARSTGYFIMDNS